MMAAGFKDIRISGFRYLPDEIVGVLPVPAIRWALRWESDSGLNPDHAYTLLASATI